MYTPCICLKSFDFSNVHEPGAETLPTRRSGSLGYSLT